MFFSRCFTVICRDVQSCSASKVSRCKVLCIVLHLLLHSPHFRRNCWWTSFVSLCSFHCVFLTFHVFFLRIGWCEHLSLRVEAGKGRLYSVTSRHKTQAFHNEWGGERKETSLFDILFKNIFSHCPLGEKMTRYLWQHQPTSYLRPFVFQTCFNAMVSTG